MATMSSSRKTLTPIEILRNCRGKAVSIELTNGDTINGIVMRTDRAMNIVLKQCIRTGSDGSSFWKARESLVRGTSVRNIRMDSSALRVTASAAAVAGGDRKRERGKTAGETGVRNRVDARMHKTDKNASSGGYAKGMSFDKSGSGSSHHAHQSGADTSSAHATNKRTRKEV